MNFGKFKGISREREIEAREESKIEMLLKIGDNVVQENNTIGPTLERYKKIYDALKNDALRGFEFDENDLKYFIYAVQARDYSGNGKLVRGLYSGCLLQLLTERNRDAGKETRFHIDGKGLSFPHLFSFAREVDELIVENFKGITICNYLGWDGGSVGLVLGKNIEGENALASIGSGSRRAGIILGINIKGDGAMFNVGKRAETDLMLASGIEGNKALSDICDWGAAGLIIGNDIKGDYSFHDVGKEGDIGAIICRNIRGKYFFAGATDFREIKIILATGIEQESSLFDNGQGLIGTVLCNKIKGGKPFAKYAARKVCAEESREEYDKLLKEYRFNEMLELIDMKGKSTEEIIKDAYKIRDIYNSIKGKLDK